jgi:hypothetical protein
MSIEVHKLLSFHKVNKKLIGLSISKIKKNINKISRFIALSRVRRKKIVIIALMIISISMGSNCLASNEKIKEIQKEEGLRIADLFNSAKAGGEGADVKMFQKDINKEMAKWTEKLNNKIESDCKRAKELEEKEIRATEEQKKVANEIIEKSQGVSDLERIGISLNEANAKSIQGEYYADLLIFASISMGETKLTRAAVKK